jgi:Ca2+-binding RTX toxin-like protein
LAVAQLSGRPPVLERVPHAPRGCLDDDRDDSADRCRRAAHGAHQVAVQRDPVLRHAPLQRPQGVASLADTVVDGVLQAILLVKAGPGRGGLGEEVGELVAAARFERHEVVDLVPAGAVVGDPVRGVDAVLGRLGDVAHAGRAPPARIASSVNLATAAAQSTVGGATDTVLGAENVVGSAFADTLTGTAAANSLKGGDGDDSPVGAAGNDDLDGGPGTDTADYSAAPLGVTVDLSIDGPQNTGGAGTDTLEELENLTGGAARDRLTGGAGANVLIAGAGNDVLRASPGGDTIDGGSGADTVDYSARRSRVTINLTAGSATSSGTEDVLVAIENAAGGAGDDLLTGDTNANVLDGGSGNDRLRGLGGDDILRGGRGADVLTGFTGADDLDGGAGADTADYSGFFSANLLVGVVVDLHRGEATGDGADSLVQVENVKGSEFDDRIVGNQRSNVLVAGGGKDVIDGRGGADRMTAGAGNDVLIGGKARDRLLGGSGSDRILARDGAPDRVDGGPGRDSARVDARRDEVKSVAVLLR